MSDRPDAVPDGPEFLSADELEIVPEAFASAHELSGEVAVEPVEEAHADSLEQFRLRRGPGFWESIGWVIGFFIFQLLLGIAFAVLYFAGMLIFDPDFRGVIESPELIQQFFEESQPLILAAAQGGLILLCLMAARFRWGPHYATSLKLNRIRFIHVLAVIGMMLPAQIVSQTVYVQAKSFWDHLTGEIPALQALDEFNIVESAPAMIQDSPVMLAFLMLVIAPALNEELIFRGIIGNGLVNRYGLLIGIGFTSILFAVVHMHPIHVVAVFILGAVMHWAYVTTRTIWAPILLHFLNNGFALYSTLQTDLEIVPEESSIPLWMIASSVLTIGVLCLFLWKSRCYLVDHRGEPVPYDEEWRVSSRKSTSRHVQQLKPSWLVSFVTVFVTLGTLSLIFYHGLV